MPESKELSDKYDSANALPRKSTSESKPKDAVADAAQAAVKVARKRAVWWIIGGFCGVDTCGTCFILFVIFILIAWLLNNPFSSVIDILKYLFG